MTTAAWITMIATMGIVASFTVYFFLKMLKTPFHADEEE